MISEVSNILKGNVITTVEYDTGRRLIGVATSNLEPGPTGVAPLGKQSAFQEPEKTEALETVDFIQAISNSQNNEEMISETVDLPMLDQQSVLKEPVQSDVITENPVQVENPSEMTKFNLPTFDIPMKNDVVEEKPVEVDIQMPEMVDAVVADEPTVLNEQLFEGVSQEVQPVQETLVDVSPAESTQQTENTNVLSAPTETDAIIPIDIQMPVIEGPKEETVQEMQTVVQEPPVPELNIEMPVINGIEPASTIVEETLIPEKVEEVPVQEVENNNVQQTAEENVIEEIPVNIVADEPSETIEPVVQKEEVKEIELPQEQSQDERKTEETNKNEKNELKDIINQHRVIIESCATAISKIAEELMKAAKSLEELEIKTAEMTTSKEETAAKVEDIVQHGNTLVNEAFDRINAMAAPRM